MRTDVCCPVSKSIISHFILLDFPATSPRLSERERYVAVRRLQIEHVTAKTQETPDPSHVRALLEAFKSWRLWLFTFGYMVRSLPRGSRLVFNMQP